MKNKTQKILIVEDDKPILYSLAHKFELIKGIKTVCAEDGKQGLKLALKEKPDLILLDIILPKMDGITLLKQIRQDNWGKDVRVIILSNLSNPDREQEARELGVKDYIIKADWKIEDIMEKAKDVLRRQEAKK